MYTALWDKYKNVINNTAQELFHQETLIWMRLVKKMDIHGEGEDLTYEAIPLKCLIGYNDFRVWPSDKETETGAVDMQNAYAILNKKYLETLGYTNSDGYFEYKPDKDYFILRGLEYMDSGDTDVAQAGDEPILFYLILKRKEYRTGEKLF